MAKPIKGKLLSDLLYDTAGNDALIGHNGDDRFFLSGGSDTVNGQGGYDTAVFSGAYSDFDVSTDNTGNLRTYVVGASQEAELKHVEALLFDNGQYDVATGTFIANTVSLVGGGTVSEGGNVTFTFIRTGDLSRSLDVFYSASGSATAADFAAGTGDHVTFAAGQDTVTLTLNALNDGIYEGNENLTLAVTPDAQHFDAGSSTQASAAIIDAQTPPSVLPALHISNATTTEGGVLVFRVSIAVPVAQNITFDAFTDTGIHAPGGSNPNQTPVNFGSATPGNQPNGDYNGFMSTSYTIPAGSTYVDIPVTTRTDALVEGTETMSLRLTNVSGATISPGVGTGRGVGTILDGTQPVTRISFYADAANVVEGNDLVFHFHRDNATTALDVQYWIGSFPGGGAIAGTDFTADATNFTFVPGDSGSADFKLASDRWEDPSMFVHFDAGVTDVSLVFRTIDDGIAEFGPEAFSVQFDFADNASNIQFDGAGSTALYLAAYPGANQTQFNIGHIVDSII